MKNIQIRVRAEKVREAFRVAPEVMNRHVDAKMGRGAAEVARDAQRRVSKVFSTLWSSIRSFRVRVLHWRVSTDTNYARAVEEGTKPGYLPNTMHLMGWIKQKRGIRFGATRQGTAARQSQYDELKDRAWGLAKYIERHGTRAHPYMGPAVDVKRPRVIQLVEEGVQAGLMEAFGER